MERLSISFKLFGIPTVIHPSFWLIAFLGASHRMEQPVLVALWMGTLAVSILWHELGHALAFKAFGKPSNIELYSFGGLTHAEDKSPGSLSTFQSILVSFAGPGIGILIGGLVYVLAATRVINPMSEIGQIALADFLFVNINWSLVNLLPMLPLDGGNIMASLFQAWKGKTGILYGVFASALVALATAAVCYEYHYRFLAMFAVVFAIDNGRRWTEYRKYFAEEPIREKYNAAHALYVKEDWVAAEKAAEAALTNLQDEKWKFHLLSIVCVSRLKQKNGDAAWLALQQIHPDQIPNEMVYGLETKFFELGQDETARKLAELRFQRTRNPSAAYNVACAYARLNQPKESLEWLKTAKDAGFEDLKLLQEDKDLDSLRATPEFQSLWR